MAHYNKQISMGEGKDKVILEQSWFERGTKAFFTGIRVGNDFKCKHYSNSVLGNHSMVLIEEVKNDGKLKLRRERINIDDYTE